jgi:rhamnogalacturonyl hydrolase YesR
MGAASSTGGTPTLLTWDDLGDLDVAALPSQTRLRITVALDEREDKRVEAYLPHSGRRLGVFDIRAAHIFQPFEIALERTAAAALAAEGLGLRLLEGATPLWIHHEPGGGPGPCAALMPHLLAASADSPSTVRLAQMYRRLASLASLQFFGWQEGCVLNGLSDLAGGGILSQALVRETMARHFSHFFDAHGNLVYEDDFSRPADGRIYGIECTLPFVALAEHDPSHPALREAVQFWRGSILSDGVVQDADMLSAEGSYTLAYPMAVLARTLDQPDLHDIARRQLRLRRDRLWVGGQFYLRVYQDGRLSFPAWCRGLAWYLLGLVRTLVILPPDQADADLRDECLRVAGWVAAQQAADGLWACFVDQPQVAPDTAGSAGLAAALALGVRHGLLPPGFRAVAERTRDALIERLTPDGFLTGVAQVNKRDEAFQASDYRVISQMGMGLLAQLVSAC